MMNLKQNGSGAPWLFHKVVSHLMDKEKDGYPAMQKILVMEEHSLRSMWLSIPSTWVHEARRAHPIPLQFSWMNRDM